VLLHFGFDARLVACVYLQARPACLSTRAVEVSLVRTILGPPCQGLAPLLLPAGPHRVDSAVHLLML
jgi:hypothetical protein